MSPSSKPWHGDVALELRDALKAILGPRFRIYLDLDVRIDEENVPRPDVFVVLSQPSKRDRVTEAADVLLAVEIMSPGSKVNDRLVKPSLYREAGIPSWRIERSGESLVLIEIPVRGAEQTHVGQITLEVAHIDVPIDLDEIARYAFGE